MVSKKNETNIMVKNALDVIFGGLSYWMFGFAFSRGKSDGYTNPFSGAANFFADSSESTMGSVFALYFFQASFATTATTIVSGAVAERANLQAYMVFSFTNTLAFCFPAYWVWGDHGWLKKLGVIDVGGASPVHLVGGVAGLVGTIMLKPRRNKFTASGRKQKMASPMNVLLGTFMLALWWGWLGFNCGSTFGVSGGKWKLASRSAVCTLNASIGGGIFAHLFGVFYFKRVDVPTLMTGILGSLVSITAICAVARPGESIFIGLIGSVIAVLGWLLLEKLKIDDPVGAISTHAGASLWGMLAVAFFVEQDRLEDFSETYGVFKGGHIRLLGVQLLACLTIGLWSAVISFLQFYIIGKFIHFRFSEYEERLGADFCEHAVNHSTERQTPQQLERMRAALVPKNKVAPTGHKKEDVYGKSITGLGKFKSAVLSLRGFQRKTRVIPIPQANQLEE